MALHVCHVKQIALTDDSHISIGISSVWLFVRLSLYVSLDVSQLQPFPPQTSTNESDVEQHTLNNTS